MSRLSINRFRISRFRIRWSLLLLLLAGCARYPAPASSALTSTPGESQALCLASVEGDTEIDRDLRHSQDRARSMPSHGDRWVASGRGWVRKARWSADPGFYLNVEGCAAQALQAEPGYVPAMELRSLVLMNNHQFESARELAEQILQRSPDSAVADGTLSDASLELGRYQQAAQAAQAQMNAQPGMAALSRAAYLNWLKGDIRSAKLFIRDALLDRNAADPEAAAWTFVEAGMMYWQQGDYQGADAIFSEALRWVPNYPAALVGRGRVALAQGKASDAINSFAAAQRQRPLVETAWLLGDAYTLAHDNEHARQAYEDAERLGRRGDRFTLALFLASKHRDADRALGLIETERSTRGGIYVDDAYAWALYRAGRFDEASKASAQALRLGTRDARLLFHAGAIALANHDPAQGRKLIGEAMALNPGFDMSGAAEARQMLASTSQLADRN
ncbi:MAG TPA: tetratricopeptide repeat protein [Xanthomonadaceae bacterium]|jgi:tetratricopeptide (TPR) repeat protein